MVGIVLNTIITAFFIGLLARWAVPGPDPMPAWLTVVIGLIAAAIGFGAVIAVEGSRPKEFSTGFIASIVAGVVLVVLYRHFIQRRPIWGKGAFRFPERGAGVEQYRERLKQMGIDPDQIGTGQPFGTAQPGMGVPRPAAPARDHPGEPTENPAHYLGLLEELHDSGVLDDTEFNEARTRLLEKLR